MTELAIRNDQYIAVPTPGETGAVQLAQWAKAADAAYRLADTLCSTQFAPAAYRGKPQEATAAILAGAEVGLSPMAALRAFDNIQGTPAPKAVTLRAIVQGQGHEVKVLESSPTRAVVAGRRKGDDDWQTSTWTIERAQQMGLTGKEQWKKQPAAMLVARASSEVCRWVASDAIMGMPYSVEEIRDQDGDYEAQARPRPMRVTAAEILGSTELEPAPAPAHPRELDPEPSGGSYLVDPDCVVDPKDVTVASVLGWIANVGSQHELDEVKQLCRDHGIRDQQVLDAWAARSAELAEAA